VSLLSGSRPRPSILCVSPITEAYYAARAFARSPNFSSFCVTKEEFAEGGSNACRRKFHDNQFGGIVSSSAAAEGKAGEDEALTEGESRGSTAKVDVAAAKAQADKDARAARRQSRGARK
jgi:actin-related protein 6